MPDGEVPEEPMLVLSANRAGLDLLSSLLEVPCGADDPIPVWETLIPLRITQADLRRHKYNNGDLARVAFFVTEDGGVEGIPAPDEEHAISPFPGMS